MIKKNPSLKELLKSERKKIQLANIQRMSSFGTELSREGGKILLWQSPPTHNNICPF